MFCSKWIWVFLAPKRTSGLAARWHTTSTPSRALPRSMVRRSPSMKVKASLPIMPDMNSRFPAERLSTPTTSLPRASSSSARWLAMNPAHPVTNIFLPVSFIQSSP